MVDDSKLFIENSSYAPKLSGICAKCISFEWNPMRWIKCMSEKYCREIWMVLSGILSKNRQQHQHNDIFAQLYGIYSTALSETRWFPCITSYRVPHKFHSNVKIASEPTRAIGKFVHMLFNTSSSELCMSAVLCFVNRPKAEWIFAMRYFVTHSFHGIGITYTRSIPAHSAYGENNIAFNAYHIAYISYSNFFLLLLFRSFWTCMCCNVCTLSTQICWFGESLLQRARVSE